MRKFRLVRHNTETQKLWGNNDDTTKHLELGKVYKGREEVHTWHTEIIIDGRKYNSVLFEEVLAHE